MDNGINLIIEEFYNKIRLITKEIFDSIKDKNSLEIILEMQDKEGIKLLHNMGQIQGLYYAIDTLNRKLAEG